MLSTALSLHACRLCYIGLNYIVCPYMESLQAILLTEDMTGLSFVIYAMVVGISHGVAFGMCHIAM